MNRAYMITFAALLAAAASLAGEPPAKADVATNAALKYWQAFAQLPPRDEAQQRRLADWRTTPLDDAARKLASESEKSFLYLRRGAALPQCDWSLDYEDGVGLLLPHLDKARTLALFACLRARIALADGQAENAVDNLLAALALGRRVADPIMIALLVDYAVEQNAIDALALVLPQLDGPALRRLAERLDALPPAATLDQTIVTERDYFGGWTIRWLKEQERTAGGNLRANVQALIVGSQDAEEVMKLVDDRSARRLIETLEALGPFYEEQRRLVGLPRKQFLAEWPTFQKKHSANPVGRLMLPALVKVVDARDRAAGRLALLKAAVAVKRDGEPALAKHADPFGTGPFQYTARPHGFELRSALQIDGKPVTLVVGPPDAAP
jgi:hypothetical protein